MTSGEAASVGVTGGGAASGGAAGGGAASGGVTGGGAASGGVTDGGAASGGVTAVRRRCPPGPLTIMPEEAEGLIMYITEFIDAL